MTVDTFRYLQARLHLKSERGTAFVEYAFLLALIVVVCILAMEAIGTKTNAKFESINSSIQ